MTLPPVADPGPSPAPSGSAHDPYAALRVPAFRWFVSALLLFTVATQIQAVVVGWQVYALTRDPLSLGLVGLAEALPFISLALFAGHVADRANRRTVSMLALGGLSCCTAALLLITLAPSVTAGGRVWPFYLIIGLAGIGRSFLQPARTALSAELVPRELYANSVAWRSSSWQFAAVVGPAVGGGLYAIGGPSLAYGVDIALLVAAMLALMMVPAIRRVLAPSPSPVGEGFSSGLRFVLGQPIILGALTLDLFSVLFGGATALLPVFAAEILKVGPEGLGLLRAAPAAGAVTMGLYVAHRPPFKHAGRMLFGAVALFGLAMIAFALSRNFFLSIGILIFSGMVDAVSVLIRSTLLQVYTPEHLLGRVSAVNQMFIGSSNEIGAFESGVAAKLLGTVPSVVAGGLATLAVVAVTAWRVGDLRRLREIRAAR